MATKKQTEGKQPIKIREKVLADGSISLYLDCYVNGKRSYETLKLYLLPEVGSRTEIAKIKAQNKSTLETAEAIKDQRYLEILAGKDGITRPKVSKMLLSDWMAQVLNLEEEQGKSGIHHTRLTAKHLAIYKPTATLADIDEAFVLGFIKYLQNKAVTQRMTLNLETGKEEPVKLSDASVWLYFTLFNAAINDAVKEKLMPFNPTDKLNPEDKPKRSKGTKTYLEIDEVKRLVDTPCSNEMVKRAFLFGCATGLRVSDIRGLKWGNITDKGGVLFGNIIMQKTKKPFEFAISQQAARWMPERDGAAEDMPVFTLGKDLSNIEDHLSKWAQAAKIEKHVTFHVSRHTFATMMCSQSVDIYTTQKLLGHSDISMTMVYAKIVDDAKAKAVNVLNDLF